MKEMVGCVHNLVVKKKCLVQFEDGQKIEISSCLILYLSSK